MNSDEWAEVEGLCPICGHAGWCRVSSDRGAVVCRRESRGGKEKTDSAGQTYWVHMTRGVSVPRRYATDTHQPASMATRDVVYRAFLAGLRLSREHQHALEGRGLQAHTIDLNGYRSLPGPGRWQGRSALATELADRFSPDVLLSVPGFLSRAGRDGRAYMTTAGVEGLLIPVRDVDGQVIALQIRPDGQTGGKYRWLSSRRDGGPGPGSPAHMPLIPSDVERPQTSERVAVYEGILKADVASALDPEKLPAVGISGHAAWVSALPILAALRPRVVRYYPDPDAWANAAVGRSLHAFVTALLKLDFKVEIARYGNGKA